MPAMDEEDTTSDKILPENKLQLNMLPYDDSDPVIKIDRDGIITHTNTAAQLLLKNWGCANKSEEYKIGDFAPKLLQDASFEAFTRQTSKSLEIKFDESTYLFFIIPLPNAGSLHIHGIDVSDKKEIISLKWNEETQKKLLEGILDAVLLIEPQTGAIVDCNLAATKLLDNPKSKIVGMHQKYLHPQEKNIPVSEKRLDNEENEECAFESQIITNKGKIKDVIIKSSIIDVNGKNLLQGAFRDITSQKQMEKRLRELAYKLNDLSAGDCFICESHERCFKAYVDLTTHGFAGLCIVREDPERIINDYCIKKGEVKLLSSKSIGGFQALPDLQAISLAISEILKAHSSCVILLDGLEYLIARFSFDSVYSLIQEKRFDILENEALLLMPFNFNTLGEREKALLTSEAKILKCKH